MPNRLIAPVGDIVVRTDFMPPKIKGAIYNVAQDDWQLLFPQGFDLSYPLSQDHRRFFKNSQYKFLIKLFIIRLVIRLQDAQPQNHRVFEDNFADILHLQHRAVDVACLCQFVELFVLIRNDRRHHLECPLFPQRRIIGQFFQPVRILSNLIFHDMQLLHRRKKNSGCFLNNYNIKKSLNKAIFSCCGLLRNLFSCGSTTKQTNIPHPSHVENQKGLLQTWENAFAFIYTKRREPGSAANRPRSACVQDLVCVLLFAFHPSRTVKLLTASSNVTASSGGS